MKNKKSKLLFLTGFSSEMITEFIITPTIIFTNAFLLFLGIPIEKIVILTSINLLSNVSQIFSSLILKITKSRKKTIIFLSIIQYTSFLFIPIVLLNQKYAFILLCFCYLLGFSAKNLKSVMWVDWSSRFVDIEIRGRFYSKRNIINNTISMIFSSSMGMLLEQYRENIIFYYICFGFILIFALIDISCYISIPDDNQDIEKNITKISDIFTIPTKNKLWISYMIFISIWFFAVHMSNPYYTYYFREEVNITYSIIGFVTAFTCICKIIIGHNWGIWVDKFGFKKILLICGIGFGVMNASFSLISNSTKFLYPFLFLLQGLFMIGFYIAKFNSMLSIAPSEQRIIYMNFEGVCIGLVSFLAPNISKLAMDTLINNNITFLWFNSYQTIFLIGGFLQVISIIFFIFFGINKLSKK